MRLMGFFAIIPVSFLLTISFFVQFASSKTEIPMLKKFGSLVTILLWISAGLMVLGGIYVLITGHHPAEAWIHQMMQGMPQTQPQ